VKINQTQRWHDYHADVDAVIHAAFGEMVRRPEQVMSKQDFPSPMMKDLAERP
jgi:hypothetical protein